MSHLTDAQIQSLADGTLRGPEGLAAREHCDGCAACGSELTVYSALAGRLSALRDPEPPGDFTATVLAAVQVREAQLVSRRHTLLAAVPAFARPPARIGPGRRVSVPRRDRWRCCRRRRHWR